MYLQLAIFASTNITEMPHERKQYSAILGHLLSLDSRFTKVHDRRHKLLQEAQRTSMPQAGATLSTPISLNARPKMPSNSARRKVILDSYVASMKTN
eukprot:c43535_g1_i1 orf=108-398(+)